MRIWCVAAAAGTVLLGCAGQKAQVKPEAVSAQSRAEGGSGEAGLSRYVDRELGFEVARPSSIWTLDISNEGTVEGIATPVVMRNEETGAQVVIQVAPAVASPHQFAERLTEGMRTQPGFITSEPEPLALADDAVGFRFAMGERVYGRVAVRNGADGRVLMMLATWPANAPEAATLGVDDVFRSVHPVDVAPVP